MKPLISVIVPIYNVEEYLDMCIKSILNQTYENLEIILVDDGSPDKCGIICDKYEKKDTRISVIHKKNGGLSDARNHGLKRATGEFIYFIDSDDFIEKDTLEHMMNNLNSTNSDISICGRYYLYGSEIVLKQRQNIFLELDSEQAINKMNLIGYYDVASWDKLYKRDLFENIQFLKGELSEDWFVTYKLFDRAKKIIYDSTPKYYYRQRSGSITHKKSINYNPIIASKEVLDFVGVKYPNSKNIAITAYVFANIGVYDNLILYDTNNKTAQKEILEVIKKYYQIVIDNREVLMSRRAQLILLNYCPSIYKAAFKIFHKIRKK